MIPTNEVAALSHYEVIIELTGTPKTISLSVKEIAERLILDRSRNTKNKEKVIVINVLLRKDVWQIVCGVGNINFQGCLAFTIH